MPREKMKISERAKIFAPFDALKGFREMLREQELIKEDKKELSEDMINDLSIVINSLQIQDLIEVKHYDSKEECYIITTGVLTKIDKTYHKLTIVKTKINIDDIYSINIIERFEI